MRTKLIVLIAVSLILVSCGQVEIPKDSEGRELFSFNLGYDYFVPGEGDSWQSIAENILENPLWARELEDFNNGVSIEPGVPIKLPLMFDIEARSLVFNKLTDDNILVVITKETGFDGERPTCYLCVTDWVLQYPLIPNKEWFMSACKSWIDAPFLKTDRPVFIGLTKESKPRLYLFKYRARYKGESLDEFIRYRGEHEDLVKEAISR